jgi:hypothetical protein
LDNDKGATEYEQVRLVPVWLQVSNIRTEIRNPTEVLAGEEIFG